MWRPISARRTRWLPIDTLQDSMATYRHQLDSSDIRFWFPNDDDTFFDALFAQLAEDAQARPHHPHHALRRLADRDGPHVGPTARLHAEDLRRRRPRHAPLCHPHPLPTPSAPTAAATSCASRPSATALVVRCHGNYGPMMQDFRVGGSATITITAATHRGRRRPSRQFSQFKLVFNNRPSP